MKTRALGLTLAIALVAPLGAGAQGHAGGGHAGGGPGRGGGAPRAVAPRTGAPRTAPQPGGFNLQRDITAPVGRPAAPARAGNVSAPAVNARPPFNARLPVESRPSLNGRLPVDVSRRHRIVTNPVRRGESAWEWNRGVVWAAAPAYWGGGFWGPFAFGATAVALGAAAYGSFVDPAANAEFPSYQVAPGSPGAALLENYNLTQTPCGPPDLVVIFGPDNSVICAAPNDLVGSGEYELDSSNLTLVSQ
jgi:hypothetical protein